MFNSEYNCKRCGHKWIPRDLNYLKGIKKPIKCPKCKSPYWDTTRKI